MVSITEKEILKRCINAINGKAVTARRTIDGFLIVIDLY